jgi:hypothetical protein
VAKNLAAGTLGVVAGTKVFNTVLAATDLALDKVGESAGDVIERYSGFQSTASKITGTLSDQTRAMNGAAASAIAASAAQAGLGANAFSLVEPLLKQRVETEAGNKALHDQLDLLHAFQGVNSQQLGRGFDRGLVETTGGLNVLGVQTPIGGTPSTLELINNGLGGVNTRTGTRPSGPQDSIGGAFHDIRENIGLGAALLNPMDPLNHDPSQGAALRARVEQEQAAGKPLIDPGEAARSFQTGVGVVTNLGSVLNPFDNRSLSEKINRYNTPNGDQLYGQQVPQPTDLRDSRMPEGFTKASQSEIAFQGAFRADLEDASKRGGGSLKFLDVTTKELIATQQKQIEVLRDSGIPAMQSLADNLEKGGLALGGVNSSGSPQDFVKSLLAQLKSVTIGASRPEASVLIKQLTERTIPAQQHLIRAEGNFERKEQIPAQFALDAIANPLPKIGSTYSTAGGDSAAFDAVGKYRKVAGEAQDFINQKVAEGRKALIDLVPHDLQGEFKGLLGEIASTGQQIVSIQTSINKTQLTAQVHQYNNELRVANRSYQDALALAGKRHDAEAGAVGDIERQNMLLNRQLQLLQFEMTQRQINFKIAIAGFTAPGTTGEERAARIKEAKLEASFAQKQLDIQKKIAGLSFRGQVLVNRRNLVDIQHTLGLLREGRSVTISTAAAQEALARLNKRQQLLVTLAGSYINEGTKVVTAAMQAAEQVEEATGQAFGVVLKQTASAWGIFGEQAQRILTALTGSAPSQGGGTGPGQPGGKRFAAAGLVGETLGTTQITVGEAGKEHVAVIRNPRTISADALGGGHRGSGRGAPVIYMPITITGNEIGGGEKDLAKLASMIEARISRKLALLGGRTVV